MNDAIYHCKELAGVLEDAAARYQRNPDKSNSQALSSARKALREAIEDLRPTEFVKCDLCLSDCGRDQVCARMLFVEITISRGSEKLVKQVFPGLDNFEWRAESPDLYIYTEQAGIVFQGFKFQPFIKELKE